MILAEKINEDFYKFCEENKLSNDSKIKFENNLFEWFDHYHVLLPNMFHINVDDDFRIIPQNNDTIDFLLHSDWNLVSNKVNWVKANKLTNAVKELSNTDNYKDIQLLNCDKISDGYHTFEELYEFRLLYNAAMFNLLPRHIKVLKSKYHNDGEPCFGGGWFIVQAELPTGQISNHYEMKYWDLFKIPEYEKANPWDGHTPKDVKERLEKYIKEEL